MRLQFSINVNTLDAGAIDALLKKLQAAVEQSCSVSHNPNPQLTIEDETIQLPKPVAIPASTLVKDLALDAQTINALRRRNISKAEDFQRITREELSETKNIGKKRLETLLKVLKAEGITLKQ